MEHHCNIVPWQLLAQRTGATFRWLRARPTTAGCRPVATIDEVINERTKVVSFVHQSNVARHDQPGRARSRARAHDVGALSIVDAAQSAPHLPLDVQALGADFVAFTGHKMLRPDRHRRAVGPLRAARRAAAVPRRRRDDRDRRHDGHHLRRRRRTGSRPARRRSPQAVGLGAAVDYLTALGMENVAAHEHELTAYALEQLADVEGLRIIGPEHRVERGRDDLLRPEPVSTRTTSARCSTSRASRCGPGTTAPGRSACATAYRRPPARRSGLHDARPRSTRWSRASSRSSRCFG